MSLAHGRPQLLYHPWGLPTHDSDMGPLMLGRGCWEPFGPRILWKR